MPDLENLPNHLRFVESLPEHLRIKAISLKHLGDSNYAWSSSDALAVVKVLMDRSFAILGGDVLQVTDGGAIHYTYDNWYLNKRSEWSWSAYVRRSGNHSQDYILSYVERNREKRFIFSFVVVDEGEYKSGHWREST